MTELLVQRVSVALEHLKLKTAQANLLAHLHEADQRELPSIAFLDRLLNDELASRAERGIIARTRLAHLPIIKTLDSFDFDAQPALDRRSIAELQTLNFLERRQNVALLGPPGVGKTHIAIGLAVCALQGGQRAYFLSTQDLLDQIRVAQLDGIPGHKQRHLNTVPLLIIDELGYVQFDKSAATWFFQLMSNRYERRSTVITSNKNFSEWGDILGDTVLAGALLDRFIHHCHVLSLKGESYRMKTRQGATSTTGKTTRRAGPS